MTAEKGYSMHDNWNMKLFHWRYFPLIKPFAARSCKFEASKKRIKTNGILSFVLNGCLKFNSYILLLTIYAVLNRSFNELSKHFVSIIHFFQSNLKILDDEQKSNSQFIHCIKGAFLRFMMNCYQIDKDESSLLRKKNSILQPILG